MSRMHVLQGSNDLYQVVVHAPTPAGNNQAGVSWVTALKNSRLQSESRLAIGSGPGQISNAESNDVINGVLIEAAFQWQDPGGTTQNRIDSLNATASVAVSETLALYQERLKFFGFAVA